MFNKCLHIFKPPLVQCSVSFVLIYTNRTVWSLGDRLRELKNEGKVELGNSKSCHCRLRELFVTKIKSQFKLGFTKVFVTGAGRLRRWSQGELRLYIERGLLAADVFKINLPCDCAINLSKEDVEITSINIMGLFLYF